MRIHHRDISVIDGVRMKFHKLQADYSRICVASIDIELFRLFWTVQRVSADFCSRRKSGFNEIRWRIGGFLSPEKQN